MGNYTKKDVNLQAKLDYYIKIRWEIVEGLEPHGCTESKAVVIAYKKWKKLPIMEQEKLHLKWEQYYKDVQGSPIKALYDEQLIALKKKDFARVKSLAEDAKKMRKNGDHITIKKPSSIDPWEFIRGGRPVGWIKALEDIQSAIELLLKATTTGTDTGGL